MSTACQSCDTLGLLPAAPTYPGCPPAPPAQGCSAVWGSITGDIGNQTDLVAYLAENFLTPSGGDSRYARLSESNVFTEDQNIAGVSAGAGTGTENTVFGSSAFGANTTGKGNTSVGSESLKVSTIGNYNVAVGELALTSNTMGSLNTAIGRNALPVNTDGTNNTAVGANSLIGNVSGDGNTASGVSAGRYTTTGNNNTSFGTDSGPTSGALSETTTIGAAAAATKSNQAVIGSPATTETLLRGNIVLESKTITAIGTTGNQTINKTCGSVVFAAGSPSVIVTNSFAVAPTSGATGSIIVCSLRSNDATAVLGSVVCMTDGSFVINMLMAPYAATRVDFILFN